MSKDKPSPSRESGLVRRLLVAREAGPAARAGQCRRPAGFGASALSLLWQSHLLLSQPPPGTLDC